MADKQEKPEEKPEEEKPKASKKLLIIGLLLGLLIGGGGGAGAFFMLGGPPQTGGEAKDIDEEVHEEVVEEQIQYSYAKIERLNIPMISNNRVLGTMSLELSLEVDGDENKMKLVRALPEIRDSMLRHYSEIAIGKPDNPKTIDYPRLKKTIKDICNKILHEDVVTRVMVVQVQLF